jgi:hypothetical protein
MLLSLYAHVSRPFWTGQPLAYPAVQKSGAAANCRFIGSKYHSKLYLINQYLTFVKVFSLGIMIYSAIVSESHMEKNDRDD